MKFIIATLKSWNIELAKILKEQVSIQHEMIIIDDKMDLKLDKIKSFNPDYIFFPHWSYIIPKEIFENYTCIVFHMTDLPFGRGGRPLQNLIVRGMKETKISAIKVEEEIDSGPVYLKEYLSLSGSAEEIYRRASKIIFNKMIPLFLDNSLQPSVQQGEIVYFKRRTDMESKLEQQMTLEKIYDYIRMLDAEGYPNAYIPFGKYKLKFKNARFEGKRIRAEVDIVENE